MKVIALFELRQPEMIENILRHRGLCHLSLTPWLKALHHHGNAPRQSDSD